MENDGVPFSCAQCKHKASLNHLYDHVFFFSTGNDLLYLPVAEKKNLISSQASHFVKLSETSLSPAPEEFYSVQGNLQRHGCVN